MKNILVYGDVFIDEYIGGTALERKNPEGAAPLINNIKTKVAPGGAANVAMNLGKMGTSVNLVTPWGIEDCRILKQLNDYNVTVFPMYSYATKETFFKQNKKTRIIADDIYQCRLDWEHLPSHELGHEAVKCMDLILKDLNKNDGLDAIVISDYSKGAVTRGRLEATGHIKISPVVEHIFSFAHINEVPIIIDSKLPWWIERNDFTAVLPNEKEWGLTKQDPFFLARQNPHIYYIITRSENGMSLYKDVVNLNVEAMATAIDVTGAGDSVVAAFTLKFLKGGVNTSDDLHSLLTFVNAAGAAATQHCGTYAVPLEEIYEIIIRRLYGEKNKEVQESQYAGTQSTQ